MWENGFDEERSPHFIETVLKSNNGNNYS